MKRLHSLLIAVALLLHGYNYAQEPPHIGQHKERKPTLFASLPDSFEVDRSQLQQLFTADVNSTVKIKLADAFLIEGTIVDKIQNNAGSISTNMRVSNYKNALFNISLRLMADNSTSMRGRILHPRYRDLLILYKVKDRYFIKKGSQELYMPE
jgi:hypothetical protein